MKARKKANFEELSELRGEMRKANITLEDMSTALGRSLSGLSKILNGDVDINRQTMKKIVAYMNKKTDKGYTLQQLFM